jgi:hypothetical protein
MGRVHVDLHEAAGGRSVHDAEAIDGDIDDGIPTIEGADLGD